MASDSNTTSCGPNATLISASRYLQQRQDQERNSMNKNGTNSSSSSSSSREGITNNGNDGYLTWLQQVTTTAAATVPKYTHQTFIPTKTNECEGMAMHWGIHPSNASKFVLAVAVRAKGWIAWGMSESGGMKGSDIVYLTAGTQSSRRLHDAFVTDFNGLPELDTRQDWTLTFSNVTRDGYLIFEAERALNTHDAQDWPILVDSSDFIVPQHIIGAWGDTTLLSFHGKNTIQATVRLFPSSTTTNTSKTTTNTTTSSATTKTTTWVDNENEVSTFAKKMNQVSDGSIVIDIQGSYIIPQKESSSFEYCYSFSKLVRMGFPKSISTITGIYIMGIEFIIPQASRPYVDRIFLFGHPNMHNWFLGSCSDHSIGPSYLWTRAHDFFAFPLESGFLLGKDASNALSLHVHFTNYDMSSNASGTGVGVRLYYSKQLQQQQQQQQQQTLQSVGTILLGDPLVSMAGKLVGSGWTEHSFTCPSSCSDYILLTAPDSGQVTVFQESFYMHGTGRRMVNQIVRNDTVIHESSVDYWDFTQSGIVRVRQEPYILRRGDEIRTTCYYQSNSTATATTFGFGTQNELCMAMLMYYPAQEKVFRSICEPDNILVSVCTEKYDQRTLQGEEDVGRIFGQDRLIYGRSSILLSFIHFFLLFYVVILLLDPCPIHEYFSFFVCTHVSIYLAPTKPPYISPPTFPTTLDGATKAGK